MPILTEDVAMIGLYFIQVNKFIISNLSIGELDLAIMDYANALEIDS